MSGLADLRSLSLMNCMRLSEGGMLAAAGGLTRLTRLSLRGCGAVTNAVAALLERLPALHSVDLRGCEHVTGAASGFGALPPQTDPLPTAADSQLVGLRPPSGASHDILWAPTLQQYSEGRWQGWLSETPPGR